MNWEKRLRELLLAGGTLALVGCSGDATGGAPPDGEAGQGGGFGVPCGNANPDPCICGRPQASTQDAQLCAQQQACEARGGTFDPVPEIALDGSRIPPHCSLGPDVGIDAGMTDGGTPARSTTDGAATQGGVPSDAGTSRDAGPRLSDAGADGGAS